MDFKQNHWNPNPLPGMSAQWQLDRPHHSPPQDRCPKYICFSRGCCKGLGSWLSTKELHGKDFRGCATSLPHQCRAPSPLHNLPKRHCGLTACISPVMGSSPLLAYFLFWSNLVSSLLGLPIIVFNSAFGFTTQFLIAIPCLY